MKKLVVLVVLLVGVGLAHVLTFTETQVLTCSLCGSRGLRSRTFFSEEAKETFARKNLEKLFSSHTHLWISDGKHVKESVLVYGKGDALGAPRLFGDFEFLAEGIAIDFAGPEKDQINEEFANAMKKLCSATNQVKASQQQEFLRKLDTGLRKLKDGQNLSAKEVMQKLKEFQSLF